MKIRFLMENAFVGGGTSRTVTSTVSALADRGHEVELVSLFRRRAKGSYPIDPRVRVRVLIDEYRFRHGPPPASPRERVHAAAYRAGSKGPTLIGLDGDYRTKLWTAYSDLVLARWIRSVRDGILVGTRPNINVVLAELARPEPVLVAQDHLNYDSYNAEIRAAIPRHYGRFDALVTLTAHDASRYDGMFDAATGPRVLSIPNGVPDVGPHRSTLENPVVVSLGRLSQQKGYDRLLPVWARVAEQRPGWRLEIYGGGGPYEQKVRGLIESLGIGDSAHLMGRTTEPFARMADASLYVMTSRREGLPMVLLEAMGVGLPIVSYDCPTGPRDLIDDGVNGFLVPNGDKDALEARLLELIDDREKRARFAEAGRAKAAEYDVARLAERWERLFEELAAAKR